MDDICEKIFLYLDIQSLLNAELVSKLWKNAIQKRNTWKKTLRKKVSLHQPINIVLAISYSDGDI